MNSLVARVNAPVDYVGQAYAHRLMYIIFAVGYAIAFLLGIALGRLEATLMIGSMTVLCATIVTVPSWPMYRQNPLRFKKAATE